jgi:hypothetical protein
VHDCAAARCEGGGGRRASGAASRLAPDAEEVLSVVGSAASSPASRFAALANDEGWLAVAEEGEQRHTNRTTSARQGECARWRIIPASNGSARVHLKGDRRGRAALATW